jgi:hypothetical protein
MPRGRHLAAVDFANVGDELFHVRDVGLFPIPLEHPGADAGLGRQALEHLKLLLRAGDAELFVQAELNGLFQRIDRVLPGSKEDDDVRLRRLCLNEVGGKVGGAERRQRRTRFRTVVLLQRRLEALLQSVAERVVRRDEVPALAILFE